MKLIKLATQCKRDHPGEGFSLQICVMDMNNPEKHSVRTCFTVYFMICKKSTKVSCFVSLADPGPLLATSGQHTS